MVVCRPCCYGPKGLAKIVIIFLTLIIEINP
jgi:hypothetical protein